MPMKLFFLPSGQKPASAAAARNAVLVNQLATPGLGSLMSGRWLAGIGQLVLAVSGFILVVVWFFAVMIQYYGQVTGDTVVRPVGWIGETGAILFVAAWLWALVTSVSLLRAAPADGPVEPRPAPPRLTALPDDPQKPW
jgi:hypothetical protein